MDCEKITLIKELTLGKELAEQLKNHLNPSSPKEAREFLVTKILSSYDKALVMLNCCGLVEENKSIVSGLESPCSIDGYDHPDNKDQYPKHTSKKRKTMPKWTEQVRVSGGSGLESTHGDGYCWRKYGQKDILGANFPRGYYRCTHRHVQGCLATKQVQRSDANPDTIEITYKGRHSCVKSSSINPTSPINENSKPNKYPRKNGISALSSPDIFCDLGQDFKVKSEDFDTMENIFPSFSFPPNYIFPENNLMGNFPSPVLSPKDSESNFFGLINNGQNSESDFSVTNSPIGHFDLSIDEINFDFNFPFDNLECFS